MAEITGAELSSRVSSPAEPNLTFPLSPKPFRSRKSRSRTAEIEKQSRRELLPPNFSALLGKLMPGSIDSDTLLIAALLLILMKEGGDIKLVLALGYILL